MPNIPFSVMSKAPKPLNLLQYHRPKRLKLTDVRIPPLSSESKRSLRNLAAYRAPPLPFPLPRSRSAAVLVALFVGRRGDLYVLLNRRSATLRSYAGDTSLPGGKVEPKDRTIEDTARREAFEEIGLTRNKLKVPLLCVLDPFMASNNLVVTPVVVLILDNTLRPILNTAEVAELFSHPLAAFFDWTYPGPNGLPRTARAHRFLTGREAGGIKPVFGLTAAVLIHAASIAHARAPDFEVAPPDALSGTARIAWALITNPVFKEAYDAEGIDIDWAVVRRVAGIGPEAEAEGPQAQGAPRRTRRRRSKL
ncbi:NUDIX hydrolase domain-like protein [Mycena pura]|uniref:NUDIX hydrolase domain-like protein n=1 Tax=Mycena pura TaxID=153505 RepID=A0AAD6Y6L2_9AGAR|nr:NUDIX hydrolase domain-like protein [Mycena pura]